MSNTKQNGSIIAIITMMFLYAMIAFVTNLAAPIGVVWKNQPEIGGSNLLGMMGNFMNFFAYLFMGIPAGKLLTRIGYKKTAMLGIGVGFVGVLIQYLSGFPGGMTGFCWEPSSPVSPFACLIRWSIRCSTCSVAVATVATSSISSAVRSTRFPVR